MFFYLQAMSIKFIERRNSSENIVQNLQKEFRSLKASLQNELNLIDYAHVSILFYGKV